MRVETLKTTMIFDLENILPASYDSDLCWVFSPEALPEMPVLFADRFLPCPDISGLRESSLQRTPIPKD